MRRLSSLLIVLLLVLRGLLGDAMAMGSLPALLGQDAGHAMAQAAPAGHKGAAPHASPEQHAHGNPPGERCAAQDSSACEHAHGASCAACGICHSAVSPTASLSHAGEEAGGVRPAGLSPRFASALPLQAVKPPIS